MDLTKFLHRFGRRITLITAAALLLAQIGAMTHAYSHDAASAQSSPHRIAAGVRAGTGAHEFCNDCLSFAPLLSAGGAAAKLPFVEPQGRSVSAHAVLTSLVDRSSTLAFRPRGPPVA
jgi:hypothetical protein